MLVLVVGFPAGEESRGTGFEGVWNDFSLVGDTRCDGEGESGVEGGKDVFATSENATIELNVGYEQIDGERMGEDANLLHGPILALLFTVHASHHCLGEDCGGRVGIDGSTSICGTIFRSWARNLNHVLGHAIGPASHLKNVSQISIRWNEV